MPRRRTYRTGRGGRGRLHRRGTAMIEFVLILPVLAVILGLTFFVGWAMMRKHQVIVADRYAAWQRVEVGAWPTEEKLNEKFFADKALDVSLESMGLKRETAEDLVSEAGSLNRRSESLAEELLLDRFPRGRRAHLTASFPGHQSPWQREKLKLIRTIQSRHGREGITWRRDEVNCWGTLRDQFYPELDDALQRVSAPGDGMAHMIRRLYLDHW
ncbi:hypothetical protein LCGC14_1357950 [marine sediment metagenome]|uniref:TadE-like domain-containing protein n=1 Tax=marine sediment metagenome TaxID=412755 RepID=A0A0F9NB79_9ZZZZ